MADGHGGSSSDEGPLSAGEFEELMRAVGPFEARPRIAVAVSGGPDSLLLALLLNDWVLSRSGTLVALTVDHGLRPESAEEARRVGRWLGALRIRQRILRWRPDQESSDLRGGIQAAARAARYRLLGEWCRRHRVLHLAVAHQAGDQAETFLLRLARGSGLDGLAGMAAVAELEATRVIRPLLPVSRERIVATLDSRGQPWIEDPSNADPKYARVRTRTLLKAIGREGVSAVRLAAVTTGLGRVRAILDDAVAELLANAAFAHPAGFLFLDPAILAAAPREVSLRAFARCLMAVGGGAYAPRRERLERLHRRLFTDDIRKPATLAGCRVIPRSDRMLVCREPGAATECIRLRPGEQAVWDRRFGVRLVGASRMRSTRSTLELRQLGSEGWAALASALPKLQRNSLPAPVRPSVPTLWDAGGVCGVPHLCYRRADFGIDVEIWPATSHPLAAARFAVA
jgi:tRNA(Ile)-lysidine synthase